MNYEVEVKFKVADPSALRDRLKAARAAEPSQVDCQDHYLAHPSRDFATSDEALRLRCEGQDNRVTYKGPKRGGPTKTREEIEIAYEPGDVVREQMQRLFANLGFSPVATVIKTRWTFAMEWNLRAMTVVLDDAQDLGWFAEVETIASGESELPQAQEAVLGLAAHLGLTDVEPRSYLRMLLETRQARSSDSR